MNVEGSNTLGNSSAHADDAIEAGESTTGGFDSAREEPFAQGETDTQKSGLISIRQLLGDTAVYGLASVADRAIGFFLLPVMTAILSPSDYGIISLFTTTSQVWFVLLSLGIHLGFMRHFTEAENLSSQRSILNTSLVLALSYWLLTLPVFLLAGDTLNRWIFGTSGSALILALAASSLAQVIGAIASNRLQAEGRRLDLFLRYRI